MSVGVSAYVCVCHLLHTRMKPVRKRDFFFDNFSFFYIDGGHTLQITASHSSATVLTLFSLLLSLIARYISETIVSHDSWHAFLFFSWICDLVTIITFKCSHKHTIVAADLMHVLLLFIKWVLNRSLICGCIQFVLNIDFGCHVKNWCAPFRLLSCVYS